ncbi:MAG: hypothetical protein WCG02_03385 [Candidatus Taylorbacteria bacterium]
MKKKLMVLLVSMPDTVSDTCESFEGAEVVTHQSVSVYSAIAKIDETKYDLVIVNNACQDGSAHHLFSRARLHDPTLRVIGVSHDPVMRALMKDEGFTCSLDFCRVAEAALEQLKVLTEDL